MNTDKYESESKLWNRKHQYVNFDVEVSRDIIIQKMEQTVH